MKSEIEVRQILKREQERLPSYVMLEARIRCEAAIDILKEIIED